MDRRTTLATLLGRSATNSTGLREGPVLSGLNPYTGPWTFEQAAHLLRRTTFGATNAQIKQSVQAGLNATLSQLLADKSMPDPPVNFNDPNDPDVPLGETWVEAKYTLSVLNTQQTNRSISLAAWQMELLNNDGISLVEKMTLFWHNHFVVADIVDPKFLYRYISTLRSQAMGNFRQLVKDVTIDPAMLRFLNGNQNVAAAPNENYARELLELFTIGKGPAAGPGDYTHYTEEDIQQMARVLTGWRDFGFADFLGVPVSSSFIANRHDTGTKQLSHRFNNTVITNGGSQEYSQLVDIIFQQDEVARFICRKLYRWFVYYEIDADTEANVIQPMAQVLIANDYEIKPVLDALLRSEHFFDSLNMGVMIKSPLDFMISLMRQPAIELPAPAAPRYNFFFLMYQYAAGMQMQYFNPPDVAGWKAYYQEPVYYRIWINSVTLPIRMYSTFVLSFEGAQVGNNTIIIDVLGMLEGFDNALDPNAMIEEMIQIFMPRPLTEGQKTYLKSVLIPGLPDFEWTVEYSEYLNDPTNPDKKMGVENRLRSMLNALLALPEYYLM